MRAAIRAIWTEPSVPAPPPPRAADWVLSGVLAVTALVEVALRSFPWKPLYLVFVLAVLLVLPWRRVHPFAVAMSVFGGAIAITLASGLAGAASNGLYTAAITLILPYALLRWGSGRSAISGLPLIVASPWVGAVGGNTAIADSVAGTVFLLFPAALGASIRFRQGSRERAIEQVRLRERERLARELHDTVAHHVSAIAIQAQAGRTTAPTDPEAALRALGVIEEEASNTLREMRAMVRLLRAGEEAEFAPRPGVADIARLADATGKPRIEVELVGDLDHLEPSVDTALYRLAQESITNARRHARHASRVMVHVAGEDGTVSLTVHDDGDGGATSGDPSGFGLAGMAERARLLGGSFAAGPDPGEGWSVRAVLPREESGA